MAGTSRRDGWSLGDAPSLDGKVAIVTGATDGVGFETALGLARRGATTILAGRNAGKGSDALVRIGRLLAAPNVRFELLNLASLASIERFAGRIDESFGTVDILVNNAGVMALPVRTLTEDGFEQQIGVNHLGHFALTGRLKAALERAGGSARVVTVASLAHRRVSLDLDDLQSERHYAPMLAYRRSKLANLMFAIELQRRAVQHGWKLASIAAHPGWARTNIIPAGMGSAGASLKTRAMGLLFGAVAQPARDAALPSLYAAMAPQARAGAYYGPSGPGETRGPPAAAIISPQAADPVMASRLWSASESLTGVGYETR